MDEYTPASTTRSGSSKLIIPIAVIIIALSTIAFMSRTGQRNQNTSTETNSQVMNPDDANSDGSDANNNQGANNSQQSYKDGTYSANGNYVSPGGAEELGVQLTIKNNVITDAKVDSKATRPNSVRFQGMFVSSYKPLVIGKNINDVELDKVSGSSLSPRGFNEALNEIKQQARS